MNSSYLFFKVIAGKKKSKTTQENPETIYRQGLQKENDANKLNPTSNRATILYEQAIVLYNNAATMNYSEAYVQLGLIYEQGLCGQDQDQKHAFRLFKKASDLGNLTGTNYLGQMYEDGIGTNLDLNQAFNCYTLAKKDPVGAKNLGRFYLFGTTTPIDLKKAEKYLKDAGNNAEALYLLGQVYEQKAFNKIIISAEYKKLSPKLKKEISSNNSVADILGTLYNNKQLKKAIIKDTHQKLMQQAKNYYTQSSKLDDKDAQNHLNRINNLLTNLYQIKN